MDKLTRIPSPPRVVFREIRIAVLPFLAFAVVLVSTVILWRNYTGPSMLVGEVEAVRAYVSSPQGGRITQLTVGLLDRVKAGQVVGQLLPADPRLLVGQLSLGRTRIGNLRDNLETRLREQNTEMSAIRLRIDWMDQRAQLASLRAQLIYARSEMDRQERLAAGGGTNRLTSVAEYEVAKRELESITGQIEERSKVVDAIDQSLRQLVAEQHDQPEDGSDEFRKALDLEESELAALERLLGPVDLVASTDGVVAAVHRRVGENVVAGELILTLSGEKPERVIGFIRQPINVELRTNMVVEVRSRGRQRESGLGRIIAVGTQLEPVLPELLPRGTSSNTVEYGLPFLVSLPAGLRALGGENVDLVIEAE